MLHRVLAPFALLLALTFAGPGAAGAQERQAVEPRAWITPSQGATLTVIRLFVEGLPGLTEVAILAGHEPDRLSAIMRGDTDPQGKLSVELRVPEEAERGEPYYFAVEASGAAAPVLAEPPFEVIVRTDPAPGGA